MKQNQNHYRMVFTILIIYLTILVGTALDFDSSTLEKPAFRDFLNGTWAQQTENYLQQHIGFHDTLFRIKSNTDLFLGEKMIQGVYITDDMLLEKLNSNGIPATMASAQPINDFYEQTQIPTYFVLVPSASEIYRAKLPANAINAEQKNRIQQIYLSTTNGIHCIDAHNILSSLKDNYIYYRTDTHWTCYGAYYVYQSAIQKMGFTPVPYQRFVISHISTDFRGNLYEKTLYNNIHADILDQYRNESGAQITSVTAYDENGQQENRGNHLYDTIALSQSNQYQYYLGKPSQKLVIQTNVENDKKLLLYKDSFADCFIPFLIQHYHEICIINLEETPTISTPANPQEYTHVLFLSSLQFWDSYV